MKRLHHAELEAGGSDILLGFHGGSHTRSSFTSVTPATVRTLLSISAGNDCTAGQCGEVSVIWSHGAFVINLDLVYQSQLVDIDGDFRIVAGAKPL